MTKATNRDGSGTTVHVHLRHLEELVESARRLRQEMETDEWRAGWMLILLVQEWARTRQLMLREPYDAHEAARAQELAAEFVEVLKGGWAHKPLSIETGRRG